MTRSHHIDRTRFTSLPIMVFPYSKRVPPKSFVQSRFTKTQGFHDRDSQGLRRPRFSFFIFTCQTARGQSPSPTYGSTRRPISTANDNRWLSAVDSLIIMRSFTGTKTCLGREPRQRRAQWLGYRPARSSLSTLDVNKSSHDGSFFSAARKPRLLRTWRRT